MTPSSVRTNILVAGLLISGSLVVTANEAEDWIAHWQKLGFWERLAEIGAVSDLPSSAQTERVSVLIRLLNDKDQSVRLAAAVEIAEIRDVAQGAIPSLIDNFKHESGEEGMVYVRATAAFGDPALPSMQNALKSKNWLVRVRACDGIRMVNPKLYVDGECQKKRDNTALNSVRQKRRTD